MSPTPVKASCKLTFTFKTPILHNFWWTKTTWEFLTKSDINSLTIIVFFLCILIPKSLPFLPLHGRRAMFGKVWAIQLHVHLSSSKLFAVANAKIQKRKKKKTQQVAKLHRPINFKNTTWWCYLSCVVEIMISWGFRELIVFSLTLWEDFSVMDCGNIVAKACLILVQCPAG